MSTPDPVHPPAVITPLESSYIRALLPTILPMVNWLIYATNLDVALHITKLTTDQLWQGFNAILTVWGVVAVIVKRVKDGNNPNSTAAKIVLSKPAVDEFATIAESRPEPSDIEIKTFPPPPPDSVEQAMAEIEEYAKKHQE